MTKTTVQSYTRRLMKGCKRQRPMSSLTVPNGTRLTWYAIALTLALTMPANAAERADSAADRADKILSGCKIMLGHLAENKEPPARGGDATFCLGVVLGFAKLCQPTGVPFHDMVTITQMLRDVIAYIEARPQRQHEDFLPLAIDALEEAWPCKS